MFSTVTKCFLLSPEQLEEKYDKEAHTEREKISEYVKITTMCTVYKPMGRKMSVIVILQHTFTQQG